jgi:hypothetical protein
VLALVLLAVLVVDPILVDKIRLWIISKVRHVPVLDLLCHGQESLLDVGCILGGCLKEGNRELVGEFLEYNHNKWT